MLTAMSIFSALVTILALPIITDLYEPSLYAQFALTLAAATVIATAASGRYETVCIVLPHTKDGDLEAWKTARLAALVALIVTMLLSLLAFSLVAADLLIDPPDRLPFLATPLLVFLGALGTIQQSLDTRRANYRLLSGLGACQVTILVLGQVGLGYLNASIGALLLPLGLSFLPRVGRLIWLFISLPQDCPDTYWALLLRHRRYPQLQVPAALANSLSNNIFLFALASAYGGGTVGVFAVALRVILFPSIVVTGPVNTVYFREASRVSQDTRLSLRMYRTITGVLLLLGVGVFALLAIASGPFASILGAEWSNAQDMILATIPMGLAALIGALPNSVLVSFGRQGQLLAWRLIIVALPPLVVLGGPPLGWSDVLAIGLASAVLLLCTLGYVAWGVKVIQKQPAAEAAQAQGGEDGLAGHR